MRDKVLLGHPGTGIFVRSSVKGYLQAGILKQYITTFIDHSDYWLSDYIKRVFPSLKTELRRRTIEGIPFENVRTFPFWELARVGASKYFGPVLTDQIWERGELAFDRKVASLISDQIGLVHVYEHAALTTLQNAKEKGITSIYEQPSQHHQFFSGIIQEQFKQYPELRTKGNELLDNELSIKRNKRRDSELELADIIRCNSSFTKRTLVAAGIAENKMSVIPLGFPNVVSANKNRQNDKVIFLNAGTQNVRKALHILYLAWRKGNFKEQEAELWLIGKMTLPENLRRGLPGKVVIKDSIPREELMALYHKADVFILPTLADGFGMVISEAMSRGVPVITTENSGGPDIITHQKDGIIIPAGDEHAILAAMRWCIDNKHRLQEMGKAALEKAKSWQWSDFSKAVGDFAQQKLLEKKEQLHA